MKRIGRILLNAATVLSLALLAATATLWVRSYWIADVFDTGDFRDPRHGSVTSSRGMIAVFWRGRPYPKAYVQRRARRLAATGETEPVGYHRREPVDVKAYDPPPPALGLPSWRGFRIGRVCLYCQQFGFPDEEDYIGPMWRGTVPHWMLFALFAAPPAARLTSILICRRLRRRGKCPACGYDLRATPDRCPECGAAPPPRPAAAAPPAEPARPGGAGG